VNLRLRFQTSAELCNQPGLAPRQEAITPGVTITWSFGGSVLGRTIYWTYPPSNLAVQTTLIVAPRRAVAGFRLLG
jgi:hypothetical protein